MEMRKNPKFILASLDRSHELPILINFVQAKYGLKYNAKYHRNKLEQARYIWQSFINESLYIKPLDPRTIFKNKHVSYDLRNYVKQKVDKNMAEYHKNIRNLFINHSRAFWSLMNSHLCPSGSIPYVFYSYLPASDRDLILFGPTRL